MISFEVTINYNTHYTTMCNKYSVVDLSLNDTSETYDEESSSDEESIGNKKQKIQN